MRLLLMIALNFILMTNASESSSKASQGMKQSPIISNAVHSRNSRNSSTTYGTGSTSFSSDGSWRSGIPGNPQALQRHQQMPGAPMGGLMNQPQQRTATHLPQQYIPRHPNSTPRHPNSTPRHPNSTPRQPQQTQIPRDLPTPEPFMPEHELINWVKYCDAQARQNAIEEHRKSGLPNNLGYGDDGKTLEAFLKSSPHCLTALTYIQNKMESIIEWILSFKEPTNEDFQTGVNFMYEKCFSVPDPITGTNQKKEKYKKYNLTTSDKAYDEQCHSNANNSCFEGCKAVRQLLQSKGLPVKGDVSSCPQKCTIEGVKEFFETAEKDYNLILEISKYPKDVFNDISRKSGIFSAYNVVSQKFMNRSWGFICFVIVWSILQGFGWLAHVGMLIPNPLIAIPSTIIVGITTASAIPNHIAQFGVALPLFLRLIKMSIKKWVENRLRKNPDNKVLRQTIELLSEDDRYVDPTSKFIMSGRDLEYSDRSDSEIQIENGNPNLAKKKKRVF